MMDDNINFLALCKGGERYIFIYDDDHQTDCLHTIGRFAGDKSLSFSWFDAARLSQEIRGNQ